MNASNVQVLKIVLDNVMSEDMDETPYWDWLNDHMDEIKPIVQSMWINGTAFVFANQAATHAAITEDNATRMSKGLTILTQKYNDIISPLLTPKYKDIFIQLGFPDLTNNIQHPNFDIYKDTQSVKHFITAIEHIFTKPKTTMMETTLSPYTAIESLPWSESIVGKFIIENFGASIKREYVRAVLHIRNITADDNKARRAYLHQARYELDIVRNNLIVAMLIFSREYTSMQMNIESWYKVNLKYFTVQFVNEDSAKYGGNTILHVFVNNEKMESFKNTLTSEKYDDIIGIQVATATNHVFDKQLDDIIKTFHFLKYEESVCKKDLFATTGTNYGIANLGIDYKEKQEKIILKAVHTNIQIISNIHNFNRLRLIGSENPSIFQYSFCRYWCPPILQYIVRDQHDDIVILNPKMFLTCVNMTYTNVPYFMFYYGFFHSYSQFQRQTETNPNPTYVIAGMEMCQLLVVYQVGQLNNRFSKDNTYYSKLAETINAVHANYEKINSTFFKNKNKNKITTLQCTTFSGKRPIVIVDHNKTEFNTCIQSLNTSFNQVNSQLLDAPKKLITIVIPQDIILGMPEKPLRIQQIKDIIHPTQRKLAQLINRSALLDSIIDPAIVKKRVDAGHKIIVFISRHPPDL